MKARRNASNEKRAISLRYRARGNYHSYGLEKHFLCLPCLRIRSHCRWASYCAASSRCGSLHRHHFHRRCCCCWRCPSFRCGWTRSRGRSPSSPRSRPWPCSRRPLSLWDTRRKSSCAPRPSCASRTPSGAAAAGPSPPELGHSAAAAADARNGKMPSAAC